MKKMMHSLSTWVINCRGYACPRDEFVSRMSVHRKVYTCIRFRALHRGNSGYEMRNMEKNNKTTNMVVSFASPRSLRVKEVHPWE